MTDPIRAALERLIVRLHETDDPNGPVPAWSDSYLAALAALSQPAPPAEALAARPLLEQVARMGDRIGQHTMGEIMAISNRAAAWLEATPPGQPVAIEPRGCPTPGACSCVVPNPPAEGEVGELVAMMKREAGCAESAGHLVFMEPMDMARAAELLEQRHSAPVPVSERLPRPEDCDAEGRCWLCGKVEGDWRLLNPENTGVPQLKYCFTHWLPAHALPLPAGEVQ